MKVDLDRVLFWMDAIRESDDRYRTLESFWKGQVNSKVWLIEQLQQYVKNDSRIVIHGGWNGVLASLLLQSDINPIHVTSIDIDEKCEKTATTINKIDYMDGKFTAETHDMTTYSYNTIPDIVINTSCEHVTQEQYDLWYGRLPTDSIIVLQSNNYFEIDEHINCSHSLEEFINKSKLHVLYSGSKEFYKYTRYLIIGRK